MRISCDCFANFNANIRTIFMRVSHECRENFHMSRTSRELIAKVSNMFKNFMRIFFAKIFRKTVVRQSCDVRASVANLSPRNFGEFTMRNFRDTRTNVLRICLNQCLTNVARQSGDSLEKTCEHLATIWRENKTKRHSFEYRTTLSRCLVTVVRMKTKISYIRGNVVRHSHSRATVARYII